MENIIKKEEVSCNFCGNNNYKLYYKENNWKVVKCKKCGLCYTNPRPTLESLPFFYDEKYFTDERHKDKFYNNDGSIKTVLIDYTNRIIDVENYISKRGNVLEIGCARGEFLKVLENRGWSVEGIEISQEAVKKAKVLYDLDLYCGIFENFKTTKKYDVVCMYQTLEHVANPKQVIEKSCNVLKQNGILIIEIPNIKSFDMKISKKRKWLSFDLPRHLNHFSPNVLKKEILKQGFIVLEINYYYPNFILSLLNRKNEINKSKNKIENNLGRLETEKPLLKKHMSFKIKLLNLISFFFPGWRFTMIAKKNNVL